MYVCDRLQTRTMTRQPECKYLVHREDVRQQALLGPGLLPTQGWLATLGYLYPPGAEDGITAITHWICIDPDTEV